MRVGPGGDAAGDDSSGRDRLAWNAMASWAGHLVFIVAGFVMPRQIDRHLGQVGLGIWDFGWTAVNYFILAQIGVGVSVNRYVARYRAIRDVDGLGRLISSVMLLQIGAAIIALVLTAASAWWLPTLFRGELGGDDGIARWVIALLGTSIAVRMAFQAFSGIVTGCHRWDLHNLLNSVAYAVTVAAMLVALSMGGGLVDISAVYLVGALINEIARVVLAFRVCPELRVSIGRARWSEARALLGFGAKVSSIDAVRLAVAQLTNILVLGHIGIGTLAVYSRLGALIRHTENIANKYSLMLTPTASALQRNGRDAEVHALIVESTRFTAYLVWPILLGLAVVGAAMLQLWMGPRYDASLVLAVMAVGSMFPISQQPITPILVGLNRHGRFAALNVIASLAGFAASFIALRVFHWELLGLAGAGLIASNLAALWIAIDTCRRLSIPARRYFVNAYAGPLAYAIPFAAGLLVIHAMFHGHPVIVLELAAALGCFGLAPLYWRRVLPSELRESVTRSIVEKFAILRMAMQSES